jgi:prepilin peptidase CpaA
MGQTSDMALAVMSAGPVTLATVALLSAALHDVAFRTIPNWISAVLFLVGILIRARSGTLVPGLIEGLIIFLGAAFCWRRGWLGGGDVKLLASAAVLVPPALAACLLVDVALSGGILAVFYLTLAQLVTRPSCAPRPLGLLRRVCRAERYRMSRRGPLPYGSAIAAGALIALFRG